MKELIPNKKISFSNTKSGEETAIANTTMTVKRFR
jgi:hypothetical protein